MNQHKALYKPVARMKEMFWLLRDSRYVQDLCQNTAFVSGCQTISPTHVKDLLTNHWVGTFGMGTFGTTTSSYPIHPSWSLFLRNRENNFSVHMIYVLISQLYTSSVLLLMHLPYFSSFYVRNFLSCVFTKSSPGVSRAAGPRCFPGRKVWTHGDVLLGINASRGHAKIRRQEKNKIWSVRFVWGVKQNSVGS